MSDLLREMAARRGMDDRGGQPAPATQLPSVYTGSMERDRPTTMPEVLQRKQPTMRDYTSMVDAIRERNAASLDAQRQRNFDDISSARATAMADMHARNERMRTQAERTLSSPASAPVIVPAQAPINQVNDVGTSAALAGNNAATGAFFITPQSTQSQFAVGAPIGGGFIGARQRGSTEDITSDTNRLGGGRKDEF